MNIYELSENEFKNLRKNFDKTSYGKRIIRTNFCLPIVGFIIMIILMIQMSVCYMLVSSFCSVWFLSIAFAFPVVVVSLLTLIGFVRGYRFYYYELKDYINSLKLGKKGK